MNHLDKFASLEERWLRIADGGLLAQLRFVAGRIASRFRRGSKPTEPVPGDTAVPNPMEASLKIYAAYVWSVAGYRPRRYDGAATLLWAADQATQGNTEIKRWRELIPKLEITIIPGDHLTSVTQHAAQVAEHLRVSFSKTRPG